VIPLKDNIPTDRFPIVTVVLIALCVGVFIWQLSFSTDKASSPELAQLNVSEQDENSIEYGAIPYRITHPGKECGVGVTSRQATEADVVCQGTKDYREAQANGSLAQIDDAPWLVTVFTSMFMHGGILHIAFNMLFLWIFGNNVEDSMGRPKFIAFYLLGGIAAVYAQALIHTSGTIPTIGASGAIAAVLGGYALLYPQARVVTVVILIFFFTVIELPALVLLGIWFVLQALPAVSQVATPGVGGEGGVAYFAHVGGFLFGLAAIKLFATRRKEIGPPYPVY
jgi:membrane associated rhomboid family serine protease